MIYLRTSSGKINFVTDDLFEILESDIPVTKEEHELFLTNQSSGIQYGLKDVMPTQGNLFDYIEEKPIESTPTEDADTLEKLTKENKELKDKLSELEEKLIEKGLI